MRPSLGQVLLGFIAVIFGAVLLSVIETLETEPWSSPELNQQCDAGSSLPPHVLLELDAIAEAFVTILRSIKMSSIEP